MIANILNFLASVIVGICAAILFILLMIGTVIIALIITIIENIHWICFGALLIYIIFFHGR